MDTSGFSMRRVCSMAFSIAVAAAISGVCTFANAQDLYVSDSGNGNIYRFTPSGAKSVFATGMFGAGGIAFDNSGDAFVSDFANGRVVEITPNGINSNFLTGLNSPEAIAKDSNGNFYVSELGPGTIVKFGADGSHSIFASGLDLPRGLTVDATGDLYVAETGTFNIDKFTPTGAESTLAAGVSVNELAIDSNGNLFGSDLNDSSILKITPTGTVSSYATGIPYVYGIAVDGSDNVYAGEVFNGVIDNNFSPAGYSTFASGLDHPDSLVFGPEPAPLNSTPEPGTWAIFGGLSITAAAAIRRRRSAQVKPTAAP